MPSCFHREQRLNRVVRSNRRATVEVRWIKWLVLVPIPNRRNYSTSGRWSLHNGWSAYVTLHLLPRELVIYSEFLKIYSVLSVFWFRALPDFLQFPTMYGKRSSCWKSCPPCCYDWVQAVLHPVSWASSGHRTSSSRSSRRRTVCTACSQVPRSTTDMRWWLHTHTDAYKVRK